MPKRTAWTQERIDELVTLSNQGLSRPAIAQRMGVTAAIISQTLSRCGTRATVPLLPRRRSTWTDDMYDELRIQREAGESGRSLADHFDVSVSSISYRLRILRQRLEAEEDARSETPSSNDDKNADTSAGSNREEANDEEVGDGDADDGDIDDEQESNNKETDDNRSSPGSLDSHERLKQRRRKRRLAHLDRFAAQVLASMRDDSDGWSPLSSLPSDAPSTPSQFRGNLSPDSTMTGTSDGDTASGQVSSEAPSSSDRTRSESSPLPSAESTPKSPPIPPGLARWLERHERLRREAEEREAAEEEAMQDVEEAGREGPTPLQVEGDISEPEEAASDQVPSPNGSNGSNERPASRRSWTPADDGDEEMRADERSPSPEAEMLQELY